ncbi:hypothetical protein [Phenylobacterium sp. 58.2.17]|uniref:hypothetical protein n=1 Tax=Phenylobacterium sp. 58.2.17 TaxID=2969306 RepID=UPI002263F0CE|nr:hypothetical protein [Phenylobacterium sp. 58.2.17]MCX7585473.1 hypothetical protein [Phenylobacterium sp. 58.2.17]
MAIAPQAASSLRVGPHGLAVSEQLVLASLRAWARARMAGDDPRELVRPGLTHVSSRPVASVFVALMEHIERDARRAMEVHCIACGGYSQDEQRVVLACGVARTAPDVALQLLRPLVGAPEAPVLLARTLNVALGKAGFPLPVRLWDDEAGVPATVH